MLLRSTLIPVGDADILYVPFPVLLPFAECIAILFSQCIAQLRYGGGKGSNFFPIGVE